MSQTQKISRNNTVVSICSLTGGRSVTLHSTRVLAVYPSGKIVLNTGGWLTVTTITRINQAASEWRLPFRASRAGGKLSVRVFSNKPESYGATVAEYETTGDELSFTV